MADVPLRFSDRIRAGHVAVGSFVIELPVRAAAESYAGSGFDFVILDMEHGAPDYQTLSFLISTCQSLDLGAIVRVQAGERGAVTKILDMAPDGIMFPAVSSLHECQEIVDVTRHFPLGHRGLAPITRNVLARERQSSPGGPLVFCQIEGMAGVEACDAIAAIEGIDGLFVGPYDLSQALGVPGELQHPQVLAAGARVAQAIDGRLQLGVYVETEEQALNWHGVGASLIAVGTDGQALLEGCRRLRRTVDSLARSRVTPELRTGQRK